MESLLNYSPQKNHLLVAIICSLGLLLSGCSDSGTGPGNNGGNGGNGGNGNDPPPDPTFANVLSIFENNCGNCHIGNRESGVRLDSYDNVINSEGTQYGGLIVVPDEPENSPIIDKISNDNPEFGDRMPRNQTPLSSKQITLIRDWIDEGAQNN